MHPFSHSRGGPLGLARGRLRSWITVLAVLCNGARTGGAYRCPWRDRAASCQEVSRPHRRRRQRAARRGRGDWVPRRTNRRCPVALAIGHDDPAIAARGVPAEAGPFTYHFAGGRTARRQGRADRGQKLALLGIPPDILAPSAGIGTRAPAAASQNIAPAASASRQGERKKSRRNNELHHRKFPDLS